MRNVIYVDMPAAPTHAQHAVIVSPWPACFSNSLAYTGGYLACDSPVTCPRCLGLTHAND